MIEMKGLVIFSVIAFGLAGAFHEGTTYAPESEAEGTWGGGDSFPTGEPEHADGTYSYDGTMDPIEAEAEGTWGGGDSFPTGEPDYDRAATTAVPHLLNSTIGTNATPLTNSTFIPDDSPLKDAFERIAIRRQQITDEINGFYYYNYDSHTNRYIQDGGNDMYDNGNKVYLWVDAVRTQIHYGQYYTDEGTYGFASTAGWPFVALMYINNTYATHQSFSIQVTGDSGADRGGSLLYFNSSATAEGVNVTYAVTQVHGAGDPSICEVYFAFSDVSNVKKKFFTSRDSRNTNDLDTSATLRNYPSEQWMGYMLLSRKYGNPIYHWEVSRAVSRLVSAALDYNYTIPFNFPPSPTSGLPTSTSPSYTTTPYVRYAYEGYRQSVCGNTRNSYMNVTQCDGNQTARIITLTLEIPTFMGYSNQVEGSIFGCVDSDLCYQNCSELQDVIGNSSTVLSCSSRCCYSSYCNYPYDPYWRPRNSTTSNITIPTSLLPDLPVEVFPNCFFKSLAARIMNCANNVFNSWPFDNPSICRSSIMSTVKCALQELNSCRTTDLFSSAMVMLPPNFDFFQVVEQVQQTGILDMICVAPVGELRNSTFTVNGPYNSTYHVPLFPTRTGIGEPLCDRFIFDSLVDWGIDFLTVLKTSTQRDEMCRSFKGLINKVLHASENRCNLSVVSSLFPCDSVLRNQLRAVIVQAKDLLPNIPPPYCEGVEAPTDTDETPDDIPFLPSCSLRQAVKSVWSCESVFTSSAPYSDKNVCRTNINRLLHCVANRLQECGNGDGFNIFDGLYPYFTFDGFLGLIRSLTRLNNYHYNYHYQYDVRELLCSSSDIQLSSLNGTLGSLLGICRSNISSQLTQKITEAYFTYAGARNIADVCLAYRSLLDWIYENAKENCEFSILRYILPASYPDRNVLSHAVEILINMIPELKLSVCPERPSTNQTFVPTNWLRSYVKWRSHSLPRWQAAFVEWRSQFGNSDTMVTPACIDLTAISCYNPGMKICESDYFGCAFCSCSDNKYKGLNKQMMQPWLQDYENWEEFQNTWESSFADWQSNSL